MRFNAIVHAPVLRAGARVNLAGVDQSESRRPPDPAPGDDVDLRFGVCCPDLARGTIAACARGPASLNLIIGERSWTLLRGAVGGVTVPGLVSQTWFVAGGEAPPA